MNVPDDREDPVLRVLVLSPIHLVVIYIVCKSIDPYGCEQCCTCNMKALVLQHVRLTCI